MSRRTLLLPSLLAVVTLVAMPALVFAHADLESATPAPDSTVEVAPPELVATFTEALDASKSSLEVRDAAGSVVASGGSELVAADGITMTLPVAALENGTYEVRWTAAAKDGHIERGTFEFTVAVPPSPSPSPSAEPGGSPSPAPSPSAISTPAATPAPSPSDGGPDTGSGAGEVDASTLLPIAVAIVVVVAIAAYVMRNRGR